MGKTENFHGDHFDGIKPGMRELTYIGGERRLQHVRGMMDAVELDLEVCPFCGGPAGIDGRFAYTSPGAVVRCRSCWCSTPSFFEGINLVGQANLTLEEVIRIVAEKWNRRAAG